MTQKEYLKQFDLTGQRFGKLNVIERSSIKDPNCTIYKCICDCGKETHVRGQSLKQGKTRSCGCLSAESTGNRARKHGQYLSRTYSTWQHMKARCLNPDRKQYEDYGGRGIKVCDKWLTFEGFYEDMGEKPLGLTLERVNNDSNYYKENCIWTSRKIQQNNRRNNRKITFENITLTVSQWADKIGISPKILYGRLNKLKWSVEKTLTYPYVPHPRKEKV